MKKIKFFNLILILLSAFFCFSCDKEQQKIDEQPDNYFNCTVTLTFNNVAVINGMIYTTKSYPLEIESVSFSSVNGKTKYIAYVECSIDSNMKTYAYYTPFSHRILTNNLSLGFHRLTVRFDIVNMDYDLYTDHMYFDFILVDSLDDVPNGLDLGTYTLKYKITPDFEPIRIY